MKGYALGEAIGRMGLLRASCSLLAYLGGALSQPMFLGSLVGCLAAGVWLDGGQIYWPQWATIPLPQWAPSSSGNPTKDTSNESSGYAATSPAPDPPQAERDKLKFDAAINANAPIQDSAPAPALRTPRNFDCVNGKHMGADWVICASPELLDMEARLEEAYNAARAARGDLIRHEQFEWIKQHATDCGLPYRGQPAPELIGGARDCIMANMKQRLAELEGEQ
jgi:uncharacterized protein YecT (DUF1311 family)